MDFLDKQIAAPKSWQKFEDLTRSLFAAVWADQLTQKNGRTGQAQHGVDVYGRPSYAADVLYGIQCKGKDGTYGSVATQKEFDDELTKAEQFEPTLGKWIFVTTSPDDAKLQKHARKVSETRINAGKFPVDFLGWEALLALIASQPGVIKQFYPEHISTLPDDISLIAEASHSALESIEDYVSCGLTSLSLLRKEPWESATKALAENQILRLSGEGGAGKSGLLARVGKRFSGPLLVIKDNRTSATSLQLHFAQLGIKNGSNSVIEAISAQGDALCLIDGADRLLMSERRGVVTDLLKAIKSDPHKARWKIVTSARTLNEQDLVFAALRDADFEDPGVAVSIGNIGREDAALLGSVFPAFAPLLSRNDLAGQNHSLFLLRELFRWERPPESMLTEIDIAGAWANAELSDTDASARRSKALTQIGAKLIEEPARYPGRAEIEATGLQTLIEQGVVWIDPRRDAVTLVHDVHEDWLLARSLEREKHRLAATLQAAGEPLWWRRSVRLLGQMLLEAGDLDGWHKLLAELDGDGELDPAWARAILISPFYSERAPEILPQLEGKMLADDGALLSRMLDTLIVFETRIDEKLLASPALAHLDETQRYTLAANWKIPLWRSWGAFLRWSLAHWRDWPWQLVPRISELSAIFSRATEHMPNAYSQSIAAICKEWLIEIEDARHVNNWDDRREPFGHALARHDGWEEVEERLRGTLACTVESAPDVVSDYLVRLAGSPLLRGARTDFLKTPRRVATLLPRAWTSMCLTQFVSPRRRVRHGPDYPFGDELFSWHDLHRTGIENDEGFSPSSPLRGGFSDLFAADETEALRLFHRLEIRAAVFWRWYTKCQDRRLPRPLVLHLPWADIPLWGDENVYRWSRGILGSNVLGSAYLALDDWVSDQLAKGRPVDELLRLVVQRNGLVATTSPFIIALGENINTPSAIDFAGPFLAAPRLWNYDIRRHVDEQVPAHRIGFFSTENIHFQALEAIHQRHAVRQPLSHSLLMPFRVMAGQLPLENFDRHREMWSSDDLASYEDEIGNPGCITSNDESIQRFLSASNPDQIVFEQGPDANQVQVRIAPTTDAIAEVEAVENGRRHLEEASRLANWVNKSRDQGSVATSLTIEQAISLANEVAGFPDDPSNEDFSFVAQMRSSGIVGAAAVAARFGTDDLVQEHREWIEGWLLVGARLHRHPNEAAMIVDEAILTYDPQVYGAWGLAALACRAPHSSAIDETVFALAVQRLHAVTEAVIDGLDWERRPQFARATHMAALDNCVVNVGHWWRGDRQKRAAAAKTTKMRMQVIKRALRDDDQPRMPLLPPTPYKMQWIWTGKWPKPASRLKLRAKAMLDWGRVHMILKRTDWHLLASDKERQQLLGQYLSSLVAWTQAYSEEDPRRHDSHFPYELAHGLAREIGRFSFAYGTCDTWRVLQCFKYHDRAQDLVCDYLDAVTHEMITSGQKPDDRFWLTWKPAAQWIMDTAVPKGVYHYDSLSNPVRAAGFVGPYMTPIPHDWPHLDELLDWIDGWVRATCHLPSAAYASLVIVERMDKKQRQGWYLNWLTLFIEHHGSDENAWSTNGLGNKAAALLKPLADADDTSRGVARRCLAVIADAGSAVARELLASFAASRIR